MAQKKSYVSRHQITGFRIKPYLVACSANGRYYLGKSHSKSIDKAYQRHGATMKHERMIIYPKDIQRITGKSERYARRLMTSIRKKYNKERYQLISVQEFCTYMKLEEQEVARYLNN